jgi:sugar-specific transcriptional regulator TrmB
MSCDAFLNIEFIQNIFEVCRKYGNSNKARKRCNNHLKKFFNLSDNELIVFKTIYYGHNPICLTEIQKEIYYEIIKTLKER